MIMATPAGAAPVPQAAAAAAVGSPFGSVDVVEWVPGGFGIIGWAAYKGSSPKALSIHIRLDGKIVRQTKTNEPRPDVVKAYPGVYKNSGFSAFVPKALTGGSHTVCAYAIKAKGATGANPNLGCKSFTVGDSPMGQFFASGLGNRDIRAIGVVADPNSTNPVRVDVYLDGKGVNSVVAKKQEITLERKGKSDVTYRAYGHGFSVPVKLPAGSRKHQLCTYVFNVSGTPGNKVQSCITVK